MSQRATIGVSGRVVVRRVGGSVTRYPCTSAEEAADLAVTLEDAEDARIAATTARIADQIERGIPTVLPHPDDAETYGLTPDDVTARIAAGGVTVPDSLRSANAAATESAPAEEPQAPTVGSKPAAAPNPVNEDTDVVDDDPVPVPTVEVTYDEDTNKAVVSITPADTQNVVLWRSIGGTTADLTVKDGKPSTRRYKAEPGDNYEIRLDGPDGPVLASGQVT